MITHPNRKVRRKADSNIVGEFGLELRKEAGGCLTELSEDNNLFMPDTWLRTERKTGHHQMTNVEIK